MRKILILLSIVATFSAEARMYQWKEPGADTTQLSGTPPAWYRSTAGGPRTFVFDNGRLIDDTAIIVSDNVRQRMRQEAFVLVDEDRQKAKAKIARAEEIRQKLNKDKAVRDIADSEEEVIEEVSEPDLTDVLFPKKNKQQEDKFAGKSLEELRALIADWEATQMESAKQALE